MVMYGSTQTHSIGKKVSDIFSAYGVCLMTLYEKQATIILGMKFRALPTYRKDDYALRADVVREALTEDSKKGLIPFMLSMSRACVTPLDANRFANVPYSRYGGVDEHRYD
jgi:aromatic-L-amino-acid decarboxylase